MAEYRVVEARRKFGTPLYYPEVKNFIFWHRFALGGGVFVFASKEKAIEFAEREMSTERRDGSDVVWTTEHHAP